LDRPRRRGRRRRRGVGRDARADLHAPERGHAGRLPHGARVKRAAALIVACAGLVACADADVEWGFRVDPGIDASARGIVAEVRSDGCTGTVAPIAVYRFARDASEPYATPTLP